MKMKNATILAAELRSLAEEHMITTPWKESKERNSYCRGVRASDKAILIYEIGRGFRHTFLNGISMYLLDGKKATLLSERRYNDFRWDYDVPEVEEEVRSLLADAALKSLTVSSTGAGSVKRYAKLPKDVKKLLSQTSASISNNRMSSVA